MLLYFLLRLGMCQRRRINGIRDGAKELDAPWSLWFVTCLGDSWHDPSSPDWQVEIIAVLWLDETCLIRRLSWWYIALSETRAVMRIPASCSSGTPESPEETSVLGGTFSGQESTWNLRCVKYRSWWLSEHTYSLIRTRTKLRREACPPTPVKRTVSRAEPVDAQVREGGRALFAPSLCCPRQPCSG